LRAFILYKKIKEFTHLLINYDYQVITTKIREAYEREITHVPTISLEKRITTELIILYYLLKRGIEIVSS